MDFLFEDSREGKHIGDYLFSGYRAGHKPNHEADQQFARPIEDEDIFGIGGNENAVLHDDSSLNRPIELPDDLSNGIDFEKDSFSDLVTDLTGDKDDPSCREIFEEVDEIVHLEKPKNTSDDQLKMNIDDVFLDDYSQEPREDPNDENVQPRPAISGSRVYTGTTPSLARLKMAQLKEKIRLQNLTKPVKPKGFGHDFEPEGSIEVSYQITTKQRDPNFEKILNSMSKKSNVADDTLNHSPGITQTNWEDHNREMRRRICAQKRKIWDSYQRPVDDIDDEEELMEKAAQRDDEDEKTSNNDNDEDLDDDNNSLDSDDERNGEADDQSSDEEVVRRSKPIISDDENSEDAFEDLEREDIATSDLGREKSDESDNECDSDDVDDNDIEDEDMLSDIDEDAD